MQRVSSILMAGALLWSVAVVSSAAETRSVQVTGHGEVRVAPDMVTLSITMKSVDDDLVRVRASSDKQLRSILELAAQHGVAAADNSVSELSISLSFNEELKRHIFHVERTASVTLKKLARLNGLLAELLKQPDTTVSEISFYSSQADQWAKQARQKAIADAKATAGELAEATGVKLGPPLTASFTGETQRPFVTSVVPVVGQRGKSPRFPLTPAAGGFFVVTAAAVQAEEAGAEEEGAFGVGEVTFSVSVFITFELIAE